jgi:hypothetical protein
MYLPKEGICNGTDGCEPPCCCWELNSVPLEEQSFRLTTEPSLHPHWTFNWLNLVQITTVVLSYSCVQLSSHVKKTAFCSTYSSATSSLMLSEPWRKGVTDWSRYPFYRWVFTVLYSQHFKQLWVSVLTTVNAIRSYRQLRNAEWREVVIFPREEHTDCLSNSKWPVLKAHI